MQKFVKISLKNLLVNTYDSRQVDVIVYVEKIGPPVLPAVVPVLADPEVPLWAGSDFVEKRGVKADHHRVRWCQPQVAMKVEADHVETPLWVLLVLRHRSVCHQYPAYQEERIGHYVRVQHQHVGPV